MFLLNMQSLSQDKSSIVTLSRGQDSGDSAQRTKPIKKHTHIKKSQSLICLLDRNMGVVYKLQKATIFAWFSDWKASPLVEKRKKIQTLHIFPNQNPRFNSLIIKRGRLFHFYLADWANDFEGDGPCLELRSLGLLILLCVPLLTSEPQSSRFPLIYFFLLASPLLSSQFPLCLLLAAQMPWRIPSENTSSQLVREITQVVTWCFHPTKQQSIWTSIFW